MFHTLRTWLDFVRFSHTVFALPFALSAMVLAAREQRGWPGWRVFLLIVAAMVCGRTCAMAFNRIVDREFDAQNPRTAQRHLPTRKVTLTGAWVLCVLGGAGLVAASWLLNPLCLMLSPIALLVVCFYSLTKRFTDFTHFWLGVALAIAPIGAWIAVEGRLEFLPRVDGALVLKHSAFVPCLLAVVVVLWLVGFDIIYATQDYDFNRTHGLHSLVVRWGPRNALGVSFLAHMVMWLLLVAFGFLCAFRLAYWIGLALIFGCLMLEHLLARQRDLHMVNVAFFRMNAIISIVFFVVTAVEVVFPWFRLRWYT